MKLILMLTLRYGSLHESEIQRKLVAARKKVESATLSDEIMERAAALCLALQTDGLRGQLTLMRAARALAAFEGRKQVKLEDVKRMAGPALRHRLRRNPLDETGSQTRIDRALAELFG